MSIREQGLKNALSNALAESLAWKGYEKYPKSENSYRSAYFCYRIGLNLDRAFESRFPEQSLKRLQIEFNDEDEKTSGEWLLDIVWCEKTCADPPSNFKYPSKIYGALECESSTRTKEFFTDFAKLIHVRSSIKIYLAGVNHKHKGRMTKYIDLRRRQAAQFISNTGIGSETEEWYLAFWPSPTGDVSSSLWDDLEEYPYPNTIHAYALERGTFVAI